MPTKKASTRHVKPQSPPGLEAIASPFVLAHQAQPPPDTENKALRERLYEAEETLRAIRSGDWDALVVSGTGGGEQLVTLKQSELRYRRLFETAQDGILILNAQTGRIEDVNPFLIKLLGYSRQEFLEKTLWEVGAFKDVGASQEAFWGLHEDEFIRYDDLPLKTKDGRLIQAEIVSNVYVVNGIKVIQCNIRDITERLLAAEALRENEERFRQVWESTSDSMALSDPHGIMLAANPAYFSLYGYTPEQAIGTSFALIFPEEFRSQAVEQYKIVFASDVTPPLFEGAIRRADGSERIVETRVTFLTAAGKRTAMLSTIRDITERVRAEEKIKRQLEHLTALSAIDQIIAAYFDLKLSLSQILNHVLLELGVDAADILILNPHTKILEYGAERGFRNQAIKTATMRVGESYAGRAALERRVINIPFLSGEADSVLPTHLAGEAFIAYYAVPLIAKGQVNGVLEVVHRTALKPDAEWLDFLNTLGGQIALAIDNGMLFESLQRSNLELSLAYDATIEGWSRALDLRDKETEGHSLRVTEMTVKLARTYGLSEAELVQIRWGALLHDIGKMGVPDGILLKPSPLTDEEWVTMKKHPTFAYEMLSPIRYLQLALDIPYCHHEKWDGSGYPRGLKGAQIPLAARIFAVVDVVDALSSDRPYRPAWTNDQVREHIRNASGTQFDPQVVETFMAYPQAKVSLL